MLVWRVFVVLLVVESLLLLCHSTVAQQHRIVYSRDQLMELKPAGLATVREDIPAELWRKTHRGCRGKRSLRRRKGAKHRRLMERKTFKPCLPSIIMGNVRSLGNKMDELTALTRSHQEYRECSLMIFSESWLHTDVPDHNVSTVGFHTVRADRDCTKSGKRKGGGLAVYVNNRWCNPGHITVKDRICSPDIELLAVGLRPYYLPREFSHAIVVALQGCFEVTDWNVLCEPHGEDIDGLTECITDYINFCVDGIVPARTVRCYPNNKPWVTKDIKAILNLKKRAFRGGNREELRDIQRELSAKINEAKDGYRRKLERKLQLNNMSEVWSGMRTITGYRPTSSGADGSVARANELNLFFNRFDTAALAPVGSPADCLQPPPLLTPPPPPDSTSSNLVSPSHPSPTPHTSSGSHATCPPLTLDSNSPPPQPALFTPLHVRRQLSKLPAGKAAGPDGVSPRVLRACAEQLCGVLHRVFKMSLSLQRVPVIWKTSCLVPVPKMPQPSGLSDYRPVALTSHIMKTLERLVLEQLRPMVRPHLDPLQFAYQPRIGVEDALIYLLNRIYAHLDKPGSTVRVTFFDFSSAFNTIRPALLGDKLTAMLVNPPLVSWIVDYLTGRPQYVRLRHCVSDTVVSNTGAPQGTVLSPFLFTLYTTDFSYQTESCHLQKFSDDSAIVGCISKGEEAEYRAVVNNFVSWCELNHLQLNTTKTKELVVDLRRTRTPVTPVSILGHNVDIVEHYKYLGVFIDNKLDWTKNTEVLYKKGQSRLYFLRRLRSFNICRTMLRMFYESVVASAILFAVVCWGSRLRVADANRLNKLIRKASDVVGVELDPLTAVSDRRMLSKVRAILQHGSHPLHNALVEQRSTFSQRLIAPKCTTERHRKSFLPVAIKLYNSSL
ncbi:uncharacterized protein LOC126397200 [Epinephelus moara]|uniref:uncharacterized protein LOC126397200 n=1 Tax=Epinephelus moara TaxID=300413 RepID=UPI00214F4F62|nr:uncharacterized protein LOC126397200 [Epinephelus moara]